jgi:SlyX protein
VTSADDRLVELESRLAHQEHLIDALNTQLVEQQHRLMHLETLNRELVNRFRSLAAAMPAAESDDQPPPHY